MSPESTELTRPFVALDVDGVLNVESPDTPGRVTHTLAVDPDTFPDSPFVDPRVVERGEVTVCIDPADGEWIRELTGMADVFWATTWEHAANNLLAPLFGIEPLPVLELSQVKPRLSELLHDPGGWKLRSVLPASHGRPLVWVDDFAYISSVRLSELRGFPTLVLTPDHEVGLTDEMRAEAIEFCSAYS